MATVGFDADRQPCCYYTIEKHGVRPSELVFQPSETTIGRSAALRSIPLFTTSLRGRGRDIFSKRRWNNNVDDGLYRDRPNSPPASSRSSTNESIHPSILTHEQHNLAGSSQVLLRARPDRSTTVEAMHQTLTKESQHEEPSGSGLSSVTGDELHKTRTSGTINLGSPFDGRFAILRTIIRY